MRSSARLSGFTRSRINGNRPYQIRAARSLCSLASLEVELMETAPVVLELKK